MRNFIYKNVTTITMVFTTMCFVVGLFAGNKFVKRNK